MVDVNTTFFNQHRFNLSWDGSEYQLIKNSTGEALETTYEHLKEHLVDMETDQLQLQLAAM